MMGMSGLVAVAGVRHAGTKVGYSNIGPEVAIAAPAGNCVNESGACLYPLLTTLNASKTSPGAHTYSDSFNPSLGTSFMASTMVIAVPSAIKTFNWLGTLWRGDFATFWRPPPGYTGLPALTGPEQNQTAAAEKLASSDTRRCSRWPSPSSRA